MLLGMEWYWWLVIVIVLILVVPIKIRFIKWWEGHRNEKEAKKTDKWGEDDD